MKIQRFIANNGYGTNVYLSWDEESKKAFLVDPGSEIRGVCDTIEKESLDLLYIIITHAHGDHTEGLKFFREKYPDAKVVASRAERKMLFNRDLSHGPGGITADIETKDGDALDVGGMHLVFIDCPGHTPGGMSVLTGGVLFSGDTLFRNSVGRTDLPGGDWDTIVETVKNKLYTLPDDTVVLPGHMGETSIGFEKRNNPFVSADD